MSHPQATGAAPLLPPTIAQLLAGEAGGSCRLRGWLRSVRGGKKVVFLAVSDGSCVAAMQVVVDASLPALVPLLPQLTTGASVEVSGELVASPARGQALEVRATDIVVLGACDALTYPLQKKGHSLEFLRSIAHLRPRSNTFGAVFRIRAALAAATHDFFASLGCRQVQTPIITASDCEGAGEMLALADADFFGRPTYLTVSGQLAGQALAYGLGRIYTFGPTFRAENSNTARHLSEFWMVEPELAFVRLPQLQDIAESYLKACVGAVLAAHQEDLAFLGKHYDTPLVAQLTLIESRPFVRLSYGEAVDILKASGQTFDTPAAWGNDLMAEHERFLVERHFRQPVIVVDYPRQLKAFYMYQNDDGKTVAAMDVLVPRIGEIIGGSQREHRLGHLESRLEQAGADREAYRWYLDLHRFGAVPHAGFGLGLERLVMLCTGMANIRDSIPFPRAPGQAAY